MTKLIECVPNFSEGRDLKKIEEITNQIKYTDNVTLLDVDPGAATNRTVVTFIGEPNAVIEAAYKAIKKASEIIDMKSQSGTHARMGATDVCPLVPVSNVTMEECSKYAEMLAERVGNELNIPVYLYEESAKYEDRKNLANIRAGEYEGLEEKLKDPNWKPDFGKPIFNSRAGATVIGAREFLIAFNINLNTKNKKLAHDIALDIREKGRYKRDENKKIIKDKNGKKLRIKGLFNYVKAVGWFIDEYDTAQISINFTNYKITPVHLVVDKVRKIALEKGLIVTGCELVGLIPLEALKMAGYHYLKKQNLSPGLNDKELINIAVRSWGLNDLSTFNPKEKIIDLMVEVTKPLLNMKVSEFCNEIASNSLAPGGGSVSANCAGMAASLGAMVCNLTVGKKGYEKHWDMLSDSAIKFQQIKKQVLSLIDKDTEAFYKIIDAGRLPKKTAKDKQTRLIAIEKSTKEAIMTPYEVIKLTEQLIDLLELVIEKGNRNSISDAGVAVLNCINASKGALMNVLINLPSLNDEEFKNKYSKNALITTEKISQNGNKMIKKVNSIINEL